jgi:predicted phosphodiesterase
MSDTHLPQHAGHLPAALPAEVARADVVVHAGDWGDGATLDLLSARSRRRIGVYGNNDGPELRARLPEIAQENHSNGRSSCSRLINCSGVGALSIATRCACRSVISWNI